MAPWPFGALETPVTAILFARRNSDVACLTLDIAMLLSVSVLLGFADVIGLFAFVRWRAHRRERRLRVR